MAVDTSVIGRQTGAWRVALDRSVLANFATAVGDRTVAYRRSDAPAPPTFTFAAPFWSSLSTDEQPADPTGAGGNPMHSIMGALHSRGALVLHGEQEFVYHRTPVAGDVLDGVQTITDIYEKETESAHMTFVVMETQWNDSRDGSPVVTERFNLIARLKR
ncbi:MAG TPA: MaoC family dehydratase N-terminal domain-containing protein [Acidimicrobiia bacterium]|nr:MaoC family dehydratase N-terminal domain-containing protein [Acidimicrobiia bacterium]